MDFGTHPAGFFGGSRSVFRAGNGGRCADSEWQVRHLDRRCWLSGSGATVLCNPQPEVNAQISAQNAFLARLGDHKTMVSIFISPGNMLDFIHPVGKVS
jgi:hypothetical protein